jgi:alpha-galactosidase
LRQARAGIGEYAYILGVISITKRLAGSGSGNGSQPLTADDLQRQHEYAAYIINALRGGDMFKFNGNVRNTHLITNLPEGACVEVPVVVDKAGFHPIHVGALPPECALLTQLSSGIEEMAINASIEGDPVAVYRAICHDPLTSAVLSLCGDPPDDE